MATVGQGGTVTVRVQYVAGDGSLVDPVDPRVSILDALGTLRVTDAVPVRESAGQYAYVYPVPSDGGLGEWIARFTGLLNGSLVTGDDLFTVVTAGSVLPVQEQTLISLEDLKTVLGKPTTEDDAALLISLQGATQAILNYTGRQFLSNAGTETRYFPYDGTGTLFIDDATSIASVRLEGRLLSPSEWLTGPHNEPVVWWLDLPTFYDRRQGRDVMGFTHNGDKIDRLLPSTIMVEVVGDWGWPYVPADVKQAAIWTATSLFENPSPYISESIEGYSRTIGPAPTAAVPTRAKAILEHYTRFYL